MQEGQNGVIELKAAEGDCPDVGKDDPRAVKLMMDYFYLADYDPGTISASQTASPALKTEGGHGSVDNPRPDSLEHPTDTGWGVSGMSAKERKALKKARTRGFGFGYDPEPNPEPEPEPPVPDSTGSDTNFLELHARVFAIASKYDIKPLEQTARRKFKDKSKRDWWIADLIAAIGIVFHHTPDHEVELRDALKDAIVRRGLYLVNHPDFKVAVEDVDGLAYDLLYRMVLTDGAAGERGLR